MAKREVTQATRDRRGRIVALCNPGRPWSPRRTQDAIRDIHFGLHQYVAVAQGREANIHAVSGPRGPYLRSDSDATAANNLDALPPATSGNPLTGLSDVVLQLEQAAAERILRAMYRAGAIGHQVRLVESGQCLELCLGAPERLTFIPTVEDDAEASARVDVPLLYRLRRLDTAGDIGVSGRATLHVRARIASQASPTGVQLLVDWSPTRDEDVDLAGPDDGDVIGGIARWARAQGAQGRDVRLPGLTGGAAVSELTTVFRRSAERRIVAAALSFGSAAPDNPQRLEGSFFGERDWALAMSEHIVTEHIREMLRQDLGALPPPFGPEPVPLRGSTDLFLDSFDVLLADGAVVLEGQLRRAAQPVVTASYRAAILLRLTPSGRVQTELGNTAVTTQEWYAALADFVSGGAVAAAVERGLRQSLGAGAAGRVTTLFSAELLRRIASLNTSQLIDVQPVLEQLDVLDAGILAQGRLVVTRLDARPVAAFVVLPSQRGPRWRLLHAGASWAPSGRLASFEWALGDGTRMEFAGAQASFVVEHEYAPGRYTARLTVTDDRGSTASVRQRIEVQS